MIFPVSYFYETSHSLTRKIEFRVVDCGAGVCNSESDLWCENLCATDTYYCQPFITGDQIYLQWSFPMPMDVDGKPTMDFEDLIDAILHDDTNDTDLALNQFASHYGVGFDENGKPFQWMQIDTGLLTGIDCFHLELSIDGYSTCEWISEPWCRVKCDERTILMSSTYTGHDCNGLFYDPFAEYLDDDNGYIAQVRVYGSIEFVGVEINKEYSNDQVTYGEDINNYRIRIKKIPPYVANQMITVMSGKAVTVDGIEILTASKIDKNNDDGQMWIPDMEVKTPRCKLFFDCNTE
jgi:hypothetical protein